MIDSELFGCARGKGSRQSGLDLGERWAWHRGKDHIQVHLLLTPVLWNSHVASGLINPHPQLYIFYTQGYCKCFLNQLLCCCCCFFSLKKKKKNY